MKRLLIPLLLCLAGCTMSEQDITAATHACDVKGMDSRLYGWRGDDSYRVVRVRCIKRDAK